MEQLQSWENLYVVLYLQNGLVVFVMHQKLTQQSQTFISKPRHYRVTYSNTVFDADSQEGTTCTTGLYPQHNEQIMHSV